MVGAAAVSGQQLGKHVPAATDTNEVITRTLGADSKIWSRVPRESDPRMTALARISSNCKRQTRSLVRESALYKQTSNWLTIIKIWAYATDGCFVPRQTDRLTVGRNISLTLISSVEFCKGS
jgi:hypothetical protein